MKKFVFILIALCALTCLLVSCDTAVDNTAVDDTATDNIDGDAGNSTSLIGTWISESYKDPNIILKMNYRYIFTENTCEMTSQTPDGSILIQRGTVTYSISGNNIILKKKVTDGAMKEDVLTYTLDGNTLVLTIDDKPITFTKQ